MVRISQAKFPVEFFSFHDELADYDPVSSIDRRTFDKLLTDIQSKSIRLEKEKYDYFLTDDDYAVLVFVDRFIIGKIPSVNSPFLHTVLSLIEKGVNLTISITPSVEDLKKTGIYLWLDVSVDTDDEEVSNLFHTFQCKNLDSEFRVVEVGHLH